MMAERELNIRSVRKGHRSFGYATWLDDVSMSAIMKVGLWSLLTNIKKGLDKSARCQRVSSPSPLTKLTATPHLSSQFYLVNIGLPCDATGLESSRKTWSLSTVFGSWKEERMVRKLHRVGSRSVLSIDSLKKGRRVYKKGSGGTLST